MQVMIGVDPHKASHTAVAIDDRENDLGKLRVNASDGQVGELLAWATRFEHRTWAVESAGGLGFLLARQLVEAGEVVLDVPATLASRARVLASGRSNKNDPNDAFAVAIAALRAPRLTAVRPNDQVEVLRLLARRNQDLGRLRNRACNRLHALLAELSPGGITKEISASSASELLARLEVVTPAQRARHLLAVELVDDIERLDDQMRASKHRIRDAVTASKTSLLDIFGVGPVLACMLIGHAGDVRRFKSRHHFAAYNGTAPIELSSGGRIVHRLSRRGNRQLNHALHMAALSQIRHADSEGRVFFDRKVAEGKTKREAMRALKRRISDTVYRQLLADAERNEA